MKKELFVRLCNLLDITYEGETAEQRASWIANVTNSVGTEGYTFAGTDELDIAEFACDDMEFVDVSVYDFMGSEYESERFYVRDIVVFKNKANGNFYVLNADDLMEF